MATDFMTYGPLIESTYDELQMGLVKQQYIETPALAFMPFADIGKGELVYRWVREGDTSEGQSRLMGANYSQVEVPAIEEEVRLKIYGDSFALDRVAEGRKEASGAEDFVAMQTRLKNKSIAFKWINDFINGNDVTDPSQIRGLKKHIDDNHNASTNPIKILFADAANGLKISASTGLQVKNSIDTLINATMGLCDVVFGDLTNLLNLYNKSLTAATNDPLANMFISRPFEYEGIKLWGFEYMGIPFLPIGNKADGTKIIPFTETEPGTATTGSSLYAVKFGESFTLPLTAGGINVIAERERPGIVYDVENVTAIAYKNKRCAARLEGILSE